MKSFSVLAVKSFLGSITQKESEQLQFKLRTNPKYLLLYIEFGNIWNLTHTGSILPTDVATKNLLDKIDVTDSLHFRKEVLSTLGV
jgi:hypothetical protein